MRCASTTPASAHLAMLYTSDPAGAINNPMEQRYVRRLQAEFDEAVKHGEEEGFAIYSVNGDLEKWVMTFKGPVS